MNRFSFAWQEKDSLAEQLARGIESISISVAFSEKPIAVTLWRGDGSGLRIRSKMHEIAERCEVGVLEFSKIWTSAHSEMKISLPVSFRDHLNLRKMTIIERGIVAGSGVLFESHNKEEIVVIAGAYPHTLAIRIPSLAVMPTLPAFEPEYPMESYQSVDME